MNSRIKVFIIVLAMIAGLAVFALINRLKASVAVNNPLLTNISFAVSDDTDNDGLSDTDESYWNTDFRNPDTDGDGFLDGEEVASGHNPNKKGPDDILIKKEESRSDVSKRLIDKILGGLYSGDLKKSAPDSKYNKAIDSISLSVITDGLESLQGNPDDFKPTIVEDTVENQKKYLDSLIGIIEKNVIKEILSDPFNIFLLLRDYYNQDGNLTPDGINKIEEYGLLKTSQSQTLLFKLKDLKVPKSWSSYHKSVTSLVMELNQNYRSLASIKDDPVKTLVGFGTFKDTYLKIQPLLTEAYVKIQAAGVRVNSPDFVKLLRESR